ncbi:MAG: dihydroorotate dehydrogenase subfamily 1 [Myxococcota bacterium]|jgi:dihydroorotate dehydrogenase subfamily 1
MADISIEVNGMRFANPFVIGSGPPGTNYKTIAKSFKCGWGGVVAKTVALDDTPVANVAPRYGKWRLGEFEGARGNQNVIGFQNIELISDRGLTDWIPDFKRAKDDYPDGVLIASLMESYSKDRWQELTQRSDEAGVDGFELNFSCPHGHPETQMGAAMGQNPHIVEEVTRWVCEVTDKPVWAKMTPNITDITIPARSAVAGGAHGVAAINTILAVIGVNLDNERPMPTVEGYSTPGGYSYSAVKPIALRMVAEMMLDNPKLTVSGIGGVVTAEDAIEFMLLGAQTVQVCTGVMLRGHKMVTNLIDGLHEWMDKKGYNTPNDFIGNSLPYFTTHHDLVERQIAAKAEKAGQGKRDLMWDENIAEQTDKLTTN